MKILLLGEYSNVHATLAKGLRKLGHQVTVVSDGDGWKNYQRDIDLTRRSLSHTDTLLYYMRAWKTISKCKDYDVVQIINPMFLELQARRIKPFYKYLRRHNHRIVMCAFGMDHYWVKTCLDCTTFRYSDFNIGKHQRTEETFNQQYIHDWLQGDKQQLNTYIAHDCDDIITGLCEYDMCYRPLFPTKTTYIPFPIEPQTAKQNQPTTQLQAQPGNQLQAQPDSQLQKPIRIFIGIQTTRSAYKGTDIMLRALQRVKAKYPDRMEIVKVESVPFDVYKKQMQSADVIIDQLYSYTPAMNALQAMSQGLVVVGGGEPENYAIIGETELRPIINVLPDEDDCYKKIEELVMHPEWLPRLKHESIEYIARHHDYVKVARQYEKVYESL